MDPNKVLYTVFYMFLLIVALVGAYLQIIPNDILYLMLGGIVGHGAANLPTLGGGSPPQAQNP